MKNGKKMILPAVLVVLLAFLMNPGWNPLLDAEARQAVAAQLTDTFGILAGTGTITAASVTSAAAVIVFMWLVCIVVCGLLNLLAKRGKHRRSMAGLFTSLTKFICVIIGGVWALGLLGVNLTGIFASLGIASLIIGFGAQSLIEDAITGIFIIFEGQYNVGDIIVLDEFRGVVRNIGIRTTTIEDDGGNMKIVNNSDIRNLQNRSNNKSIAVCDVGISYDSRVEDVEKIILDAIPGIYERNKNVFLAPPRYSGVQELGASSVVYRVIADCDEPMFFAARRCLNKEMKILCDDKGLEIPFDQLVVHQAK